MSDASQLLNLLRGTSSPPATVRNGADPASHSPSSTNDALIKTASPAPQSTQQQSAQSTSSNDLDRLFATFSNGHPSSGGSSSTPAPQSNAQASTVTSPSTNGGTQIASNPLLSLLNRMSSPPVTSPTPAMAPIGTASPPPPSSTDKATPQTTTTTTAQAAVATQALDANVLLAQLMAGTPSPAPRPTTVQQATSEPVKRSQPPVSSASSIKADGSSTPHPKFTTFVSPFDSLEATFAQERANTPTQPALSDNGSATSNTPTTTESAQTRGQPKQLSARESSPDVLSSARERLGANTGSAKSSEAEDARVRSPSSLTTKTITHNGRLQQELRHVSDERDHLQIELESLLAQQYVTDQADEGLVVGLTLPRNDLVPQTLTIDIADSLIDSLSTTKVTTTPVALFNVPAHSRPRGSYVGAWPSGLCYVTAKGRIRVIDKVNGTRILLKGGHSDDLIGLKVAKQTSTSDPDQQPRRVIASIGKDSGLVIWSVPDRCTEDTAGFEIHGKMTIDKDEFSSALSLIELHPGYPKKGWIVAATTSGDIYTCYNSLSPTFIKNSIAKETGQSVVGLAFSPDGSAFASLRKNGDLVIHHTSNTGDEILRKKVSEYIGDSTPSGIVFLSDHRCRPSAVAIFSRQYNTAHLISLHQSLDASKTVTIDFVNTEQPDVESTNFGQCQYDQTTNTLYWSSLARGSLFCFQLSFPSSDNLLSQAAATDAEFFGLLQESCTMDGRPPRIDHVTEIPTTAPIVSFVLDDAVMPGEEPDNEDGNHKMGALIAHPEGIHQIQFDQPRYPIMFTNESVEEQKAEIGIGSDTSESGEMEDYSNTARRMSLESAIYVSSEIEVAVDEPNEESDLVVDEPISIPDTPALPALGLSGTVPTKSVAVEPSVTPIAEELPALGADAEPTADADSGEPVDRASSATPVPSALTTENKPQQSGGGVSSAINAAIRSMKAAKKAQVDSNEQQRDMPRNTVHDPSSSPKQRQQRFHDQTIENVTSSSNAADLNASPTVKQSRSTSMKQQTEHSPMEESSTSNQSLKEIRKMITNLPVKIAEMVEAEFDKHVYRLEEERAVERVDEKARQESMIKFMSSQLTKHTNKLVEQTIKDELKKLTPLLDKSVTKALQSGIVDKIQAGLRKTIHQEVEAALHKTDLTDRIADAVTHQTRPFIAQLTDFEVSRNQIDTVAQELVQKQLATLQTSFLALQREFVNAQTTNATLVETVAQMRQQMVTMQSVLTRMEPNVTRVSSVVAPVTIEPTVASPRVVSSPRNVVAPADGDLQHATQPDWSNTDFETTFTDMVQPGNEPNFSQLQKFVAATTPELLDHVLPRRGSGLQPALSIPILLSLTLRLAQLVGEEQAVHGKDNAANGHWLLRCIESLEPSQPEVALYVDKLGDFVTDKLRSRQATLVRLGDIVGVQQIGALASSIAIRLNALRRPVQS
ncbi:hypothetical protein OIO90_002793 [Microbotryomycetes sp. JL221]|nr:hypothetical protein OIO90_002793 [Microbotryomycetes sp. JL221]